jgi:hypothetical protein
MINKHDRIVMSAHLEPHLLRNAFLQPTIGAY